MATAPNDQLRNLAGLIRLVDIDTDYEKQAKNLFYNHLAPDQRLAMFRDLTLNDTVNAALIDVVKTLYEDLDNNNRDNKLLEAMVEPLSQI